jgi:hypothetical protein
MLGRNWEKHFFNAEIGWGHYGVAIYNAFIILVYGINAIKIGKEQNVNKCLCIVNYMCIGVLVELNWK